MKGTLGLVVAVGLGVVGAMCNWLYLHRQAADFEKVDFVMIDPSAQINLGDTLQEGHFARVAIPQKFAGDFSRVAIQWNDRVTVEGQRATRTYRGGELLLQQELSTPVQTDTAAMIGENEVTFEVPVDPRNLRFRKLPARRFGLFLRPPLRGGSTERQVRTQRGGSRLQNRRPVSDFSARQPQKFLGSRTSRPQNHQT